MKISKRKQLVVVAVLGLTLGPWMAAMSSAAPRSKKSAVSQRSRVTPFRTTRKMSRQSTGPSRTYSGTRASGTYTIHNPSTKQTDRNSGRTSRHEGRYRRDRNSGRTSGHDGRYRRDRHPGNQGRFYWRWPRALSTKPFLPRPRIPAPQIYPPSPRVTEIERPEIQQPDTESPVVDSKPDDDAPKPDSVKDIPKIEDIGEALEEFSDRDDQENDPEELAEVSNFANKCLGLPGDCLWWIDFCCWQWWDWCCLPWYWDCWTPCYWNYVFCPHQVVVINGVPQVFEEVSYYLGVSGSQIPAFGFGVQKVKVGSPAEAAGLVSGDVIVRVNGDFMTGQEILAVALQQSDGVLDLEIVGQGSDEIRSVRVVAERIRISSF